MSGLLSKIKQGVANSGSNKAKVVYFKEGAKSRLRFLQDMDEGIEITMHDSFDRGINAICREHFDEECPYCDDDSLRTRQAYVWSAWDQDAKEVKLFLGYANNFNPLPGIVACYESYGTMVDRDYVISREGKGTSTKYGVVPMDKVKFKNPKAKPYQKKKLLDILDKAFPVNEEDEVGKKNGKKKSKKREIEEDDEEEDEEDENDYSDMSPKDLYMECIERGLKGVKKKQKAKYYIELLEEDDEEDDDEEEWEEEDDDEEDEW